MKTLYINIDNKPIQSNEELKVLKHDLDSDFFFYLGEKISKGCKVENEISLITDFNTQENEEDYKQIIAQWKEIKGILFGDECEGKFELTFPNGYIRWLRYSEKYNDVYDSNFSHGEPAVITIDLGELYEDSVEALQRKILRKLQCDDLYLEIDEIVFNDDSVTRKSSIIRTIKDKYEGVGFKTYKKWLQDNDEKLHTTPQICEKCGKNPCECKEHDGDDFDDDTDNAGNQMSEYFDVFGLIVGKSTENDVRMKGGVIKENCIGGKCYVMPNNINVDICEGVVCGISISHMSKESYPKFLENIGLRWGLNKPLVVSVFKNLGFNVEETIYNSVFACKYCKKYNKNIVFYISYVRGGNSLYWLDFSIHSM